MEAEAFAKLFSDELRCLFLVDYDRLFESRLIRFGLEG